MDAASARIVFYRKIPYYEILHKENMKYFVSGGNSVIY
jgi:hypothetical protein